MFKDNDLIEVYTEFDNDIYLPTVERNGMGYIVEKPVDDEEGVIPCYVTWADIKYINKISSVFKTGKVRFGKDVEEQILKELRIDSRRFKNFYTREKIEEMILNPTDEIIKEILDIKDINIINQFAAILTMLENTNEYDISSKVAIYIRARQEELQEGVKETQLTVTPTVSKNRSKKSRGKNKEEDKK